VAVRLEEARQQLLEPAGGSVCVAVPPVVVMTIMLVAVAWMAHREYS
jgi:hypothetical protein